MTSVRFTRALTRRGFADQPGRIEDQRHLQGLLVAEYPVALLPMLAEGLAVIAGNDHQGAFQQAAPAQVFDDPADPDVGEGDLSVVQALLARGKTLGEFQRRPIRRVGIVKMEPVKKPPPVVLAQPAAEFFINPVGRDLRLVVADHLVGIQAVVIERKALVDPEFGKQDEGGDDRPRVEPAVAAAPPPG